ncbi:MAG: hypothetical protein ABIZ95_06655, partial [Pyrinomonadaceae bacterium]
MAEPKMPQPISDWMNEQMWGTHHLVWHLARRWDLTGPDAHNYVTSNGGSRASRQEGVTGNGMDFLAMHRVMIRQLIHQFPANAALFGGWPQPPTDPDDVNEPMPANPSPRPFNAAMAAAVNRVHTNIGSFASDDELGLYLQTRIRPIAGVPDHLSPDVTAGIHNYLHNRFSDPTSPITMGDPSVNLHNQRFWRLHGWIDSRWTAFRAVKGLDETEAAYQQALAAAAAHMSHHHMHMMGMAEEEVKSA